MNLQPSTGTSKPAIKNTHINIGTGKDLTIKDLAILVKKTVGFKGELKWDSTKPDGTYRKLLDVSKINKLGWMQWSSAVLPNLFCSENSFAHPNHLKSKGRYFC